MELTQKKELAGFHITLAVPPCARSEAINNGAGNKMLMSKHSGLRAFRYVINQASLLMSVILLRRVSWRAAVYNGVRFSCDVVVGSESEKQNTRNKIRCCFYSFSLCARSSVIKIKLHPLAMLCLACPSTNEISIYSAVGY